MIRLRPSGADEVLIKRVRDWYEPGPGVFIAPQALFNPALLFTTGVNGAWYDPSDTATLFQDAAGTTPVTAVEQPVGLMKDKSGRNNHAFNSSGNSANFPVLSARYNQYLSTETLATQNVTTVAASYKLTFTGAGSITLSGTATGTYSAGTHTITCTAGTLTSTVSGTVTQADLRVANDALNQPAYQRVNTATDYDTVGFKPYLRFNGTNQWLQTNSIDFTYGDKMFVSAGVRKLSDAATGLVFESSASIDTSSGAFLIAAPSGALANFAFASKGTLPSGGAGATGSGFAAPITNVLSGIGNISGDRAVLRVNGTQAASSAADQGTGNYGNYPMFVGARAGTSLWFNGRLYQLVVVGKQASSGEIASTEAFVATKTGVTL